MPRRSTAAEVLKRATTRKEVWDYILAELPGWEPWLSYTTAMLYTKSSDELLLRSEDELVDQLVQLASAWMKKLGPRVRTMFLPFAQQRPYFSPELLKKAVEPFVGGGSGLEPFSHEELVRLVKNANAVPSRALIGTVGALAIVRKQRAGPGRPKTLRKDLALRAVASTMNQFLQGRRRRSPVLPPKQYRDAGFPESEARTEPIPWDLAALVACYLGAPFRDDPQYFAASDQPVSDPEHLQFLANAMKDTLAALRHMLTEGKRVRYPFAPPG